LKHFGSVDKIRAASLDDLAAIIPLSAAESLKTNLE